MMEVVPIGGLQTAEIPGAVIMSSDLGSGGKRYPGLFSFFFLSDLRISFQRITVGTVIDQRPQLLCS